MHRSVRRAPDAEPHEPHPHPDAPKDVAENFDSFRKTFLSGPHFQPDKIQRVDAAAGTEQTGKHACEDADALDDVPERFWNTPALQWSPSEMEAVMVGSHTHTVRRLFSPRRIDTLATPSRHRMWRPPTTTMYRPSTPAEGARGSAYYTPPTSMGVTRSRTLFFRSIRDSLAPPVSSSAPLLDDPHVYFDAQPSEAVAIDVAPALPPRWVDVSEEVDTLLDSMQPRLAELDRLHAKHLLPSFVDKSEQEARIEALTAEITSAFRRASQLIARLAHHTTQAMRARALRPHEVTAARNAQTALAMRVQRMSSLFRRKQSLYLRRLQGMEVQDADKVTQASAGNLFSTELAVQEDMELSQRQLQQHGQQSLLLETDDTDALAVRDREITQIAQSISDLAQLFQDLSAMVIEQGTMLDRIDYNIDTMATNMQQSTVQLNQAMAYQAGSGRRQLMLLLVLCIALLVALLLIRPFFR